MALEPTAILVLGVGLTLTGVSQIALPLSPPFPRYTDAYPWYVGALALLVGIVLIVLGAWRIFSKFFVGS